MDFQLNKISYPSSGIPSNISYPSTRFPSNISYPLPWISNLKQHFLPLPWISKKHILISYPFPGFSSCPQPPCADNKCNLPVESQNHRRTCLEIFGERTQICRLVPSAREPLGGSGGMLPQNILKMGSL